MKRMSSTETSFSIFADILDAFWTLYRYNNKHIYAAILLIMGIVSYMPNITTNSRIIKIIDFNIHTAKLEYFFY